MAGRRPRCSAPCPAALAPALLPSVHEVWARSYARTVTAIARSTGGSRSCRLSDAHVGGGPVASVAIESSSCSSGSSSRQLSLPLAAWRYAPFGPRLPRRCGLVPRSGCSSNPYLTITLAASTSSREDRPCGASGRPDRPSPHEQSRTPRTRPGSPSPVSVGSIISASGRRAIDHRRMEPVHPASLRRRRVPAPASASALSTNSCIASRS